MGSLAIVAAVDGGASVSGRWTEAKVRTGEGQGGPPPDRRDWHQEMMMMMGGRKGEERRNKKLQMNSLAGQRYDHTRAK